jgi:two-component system KDP operon response regulator KdpE
LKLVRTQKVDLVLLDEDLPDQTGIETCREIRTDDSNVAIILVRAREHKKNEIAALNAGADSVVSRPFDMPIVLAHMRAALRRRLAPAAAAIPHVRLGDCEIDFRARQVVTATDQLGLTPKEFELLSYLIANPNRTIPHQELLQAVWASGKKLHSLRVIVERLRRKIEPSPSNPKYLLTDAWVGYRLRMPG